MAGAVVLAAGAAELRAQQPTRPPQPPPTDTIRPRRDSAAVAVPTGVRADSSRIDSVKGIPDTLKTPTRRDSIQAPIAHAELPPDLSIGPLYRWTRDSVLATGAMTLADLLERVPGMTIFRTGFLASAQTASYLGDVARIRVFRDGVELDPLTTRAGGVQDVGAYALSNADEVAIERAAGEIRVHIRSWTVRNTTAYTRVDAFTGDEDTNLYRFFYGKRFGSGFDAQVGIQQFGTGARNRRLGGGGNVLDALVRLGWSKKLWSVDATYNRLDRQRDLTTSFAEQDSLLPESKVRRNEIFLRAAYSDPDSGGLWGQVVASTTTQKQSNTGYDAIDSTIVIRIGSTAGSAARLTVRSADTVFVADSSLTRVQYLLSGGYSLGRLRLSGTDRLRATAGATYNAPSARLAFESPRLTVSAFAEWNDVGGARLDSATITRIRYPLVVVDTVRSGTTVVRVDSTTRDTVFSRTAANSFVLLHPDRLSRVDLSARATPLSWVALSGSISRDQRRTTALATLNNEETEILQVEAQQPATTTARLEAAVRLHQLWLIGGVVRRGATTVSAPLVYECVRGGIECAAEDAAGNRPISIAEAAVTGGTFAARGRFYKDAYLDTHGMVWQSGGAYRPQYSLRGEIGIRTNWLTRFPRGNFGFKTALIDEYRSRTYFPTNGDAPTLDSEGKPVAATLDPLFAAPSNVVTVQLEIRILSGTVSYQLRNALNRRYELVPGFVMPGPVNLYGLRWTFWN